MTDRGRSVNSQQERRYCNSTDKSERRYEATRVAAEQSETFNEEKFNQMALIPDEFINCKHSFDEPQSDSETIRTKHGTLNRNMQENEKRRHERLIKYDKVKKVYEKCSRVGQVEVT
jgi:hypothetical protein